MKNLCCVGLVQVHQKYDRYFFAIHTKKHGWIRQPFSARAEMSTQELYISVRKNILQRRNYKTLSLKFSNVPFDEFCIYIEKLYKRISKVTIEIVLQFALHVCVNKVSHLCY